MRECLEGCSTLPTARVHPTGLSATVSAASPAPEPAECADTLSGRNYHQFHNGSGTKTMSRVGVSLTRSLETRFWSGRPETDAPIGSRALERPELRVTLTSRPSKRSRSRASGRVARHLRETRVRASRRMAARGDQTASSTGTACGGVASACLDRRIRRLTALSCYAYAGRFKTVTVDLLYPA